MLVSVLILAKRVPMLYILVPVHVEVETMSEATSETISSSADVRRTSAPKSWSA